MKNIVVIPFPRGVKDELTAQTCCMCCGISFGSVCFVSSYIRHEGGGPSLEMMFDRRALTVLQHAIKESHQVFTVYLKTSMTPSMITFTGKIKNSKNMHNCKKGYY